MTPIEDMTHPDAHRKPLIGFTVGTQGDHGVAFLLRLAIWMAGGRSIRLTRLPDAMDGAMPDGLILGGGLDIHPARYAGDESFKAQFDNDRDDLEWCWMDWADTARVPAFGICRGLQMLNVHAGGDLHQSLDPDIIATWPTSTIGYMIFRKPIRIEPGSHLAAATGSTTLEVNSLHRQAVRNPAPGFTVVARERASDGIQGIEAEAPALRMGVQYHPELLLHQTTARSLFRYFVDRCRGR
ncbi:gamma-glutamyl-gamma-aminobutyrate hydrolase family protein [Maricaulis salignorans]|uniref:Putative glutamine amidotransferase n=1 Tax=Maricaulis salignorans TaxID=144026 RepID=A0A1G9QSS7_9PROT|nr:gamma-glutamyl-gamma-aminobutyrate hydrolase family protein [Maricaulis salignorans]SDM14078.1 putative glutamine amidotransferase [Maricaulis salignorans]